MAVRSKVKKSVRNNPGNSKSQKERGVLQVLPAVLGETMVEQGFPCSLWRGPHCKRYPHCSQWLRPWESRWKCLEGTVTWGEPMLKQPYPAGLQQPS